MRNPSSWLCSLIMLIGVTRPAHSQPPGTGRSIPTTAAAPVTLRQVLDSVVRSHPMVQAARARVRAARGARTTARALGNPVLSYNVENAAWPGRPAPPMDRETMITAMLPAESFYQRWSRAARAGAGVRAAEADSASERQRVGREAARAFYRTALAQVATAAARDVASWLDTVVTYNNARVNEGVASEGDLIRAQVERDRAAAEATLQEADLVRARSDLAVFLGEPAATGLVVSIENAPLALAAVVPQNQQVSLDPDVPPGLVTRALDVRPDIRAARERVTGARAGVATEWTMVLRQLGAMVGTKRSAGTTSLMFGLSLPFPLFDQNRGEIARAAAERDAAAFELASGERTLRAEVSGAYQAARLLSDRVDDLARGGGYLARADEARRIALGAYQEGAVPLFQVIDAARAWSEARVMFYRTLFAQHESVLDLAVAQGLDLATVLGSAPTVGVNPTRGPGSLAEVPR